MNVAFGHTNMDLDCLGSLILIKKLYPDYRLVRSKLIHPGAQSLYDLYRGYFDFIDAKDLSGQNIENIIIVDTCSADRVCEYFAYIRGCSPNIRVIDHHQLENCDILGARVEGGRIGANTSYLGKLAREQRVELAPEEATIALAGIYADTGRFIYENVRREDFEAAAWLVDMGASLKLVKSFLETIKEDRQLEVLNRLLLAQKTRYIQGHFILSTYLELAENVPGLAAVVEKIMDLANPDAYFALFNMAKTKTVLLIARSQKPKIDLHELLHLYGGGGHQAAASAKITGREGPAFEEEFLAHLESALKPATRAVDIMTREVWSVGETMSLLEASLVLEKAEITGAPVLNAAGDLVGFISLRDIMKGRKANNMKLMVKVYMSRPAISASGTLTMREIEKIFFKHHIGHLPIVETGRLLGIVTRRDYLEYRKSGGRMV
jgi:tRNA nucleotidyltransferase (CCA-adding enzyme)